MRDYDAAEVVCMACGYVVQEKIADTRPEWRAFDDEQRAKRARTGAPMTYTIHDKGLSTIIDWRDRPTGTKGVSADQRIELYKLRKWQRRVRVSDATERNLAVALSELSKLSSALSLPKTILETASVIYRRAIKRRLIRGRSIHNVTAAAIYMSCRQCGIPRTLDEIASVSTLNKKDIGRSYRFMLRGPVFEQADHLREGGGNCYSDFGDCTPDEADQWTGSGGDRGSVHVYRDGVDQ